MGDWTLPTLAVVLLAYAAVSLRIQSSGLSQAMVFSLVGLVVGNRVSGFVEADLASQFVRHLAEATLALLLFTDAVRINLEGLRRHAQLPVRLLGAGLPLTIVAGTVAALVLFPELGLWPAAALATILAPTDAALGEPVVSNRRLPSSIRRGLNVESGLNDGICVPLLIIFLTVAEAEEGVEDLHPLRVVIEEIGFGVLAGVAAGILGAWLLRIFSARGWMSDAWQQITGIAVPLLAYAAAVALGGSGFIAAFVAGIAYGAVAPRRGGASTVLAEQTGEMLDALTFLLFGAVLLGPALEVLDWRIAGYALLSLTLVRMAPVALALLGTGLHPATVVFVGWFGPRGLASIVFVLLLVEESGLAEAPLILTVVTTTVALSVLLHGITAWPGANRYADWFDQHDEPSMSEAVEVDLPRVRKHRAGSDDEG
jgi:sodium/hydrogen antiporter